MTAVLYPPGSLVSARGREWVVLPTEEDDVLRVRPLTGNDDDATGLFLPLERNAIKPATFAWPSETDVGDMAGALLLADAARLKLRDGAAPFRSLGRISVVPRPYQFVPLVMALRQDPVRLLIADDVGVGKTIEAALIARELLDRGLARRLAVICPAHLCDQWEQELREKFAIETAVIQPARIGRLERELPRPDVSIYAHYRHLVVSIDFIKTDRNRGHFLRNAPDLVIVDEAHMAARPGGVSERALQQRFDFLSELAKPDRHLILVTATPHSGIEASFRSLLGLLNPAFDITAPNAPAELDRRMLLPYVVQRRRGDLEERWLGADRPFPKRESSEETYSLSPEYRALYTAVLDYCREIVAGGDGLRAQQRRVRYWAALALLRCVLSSPDAAASVLGERLRRLGDEGNPAFESAEEVDVAFRPQVLDPLDDEASGDYAPTAPLDESWPELSDAERRRLNGFIARARALAGPAHDAKLAKLAAIVARQLQAGRRPIVFCRFIATAEYLQAQLRGLTALFPDVVVSAVTSATGGDEARRQRIEDLLQHERRVLVATDCLSEGINLQEHFDAVIHYDLPWNPNRLEQREGRVDRFGQPKSTVETVLLYGADNEVDLVVLDVLIRKGNTIRARLGISVPVPYESEQVIGALVETILLRRSHGGLQMALDLADPRVSRLHSEWDAAAEHESRNRTYFAQHGINPDEVAAEIEATDPVLGNAATIESFLRATSQRLGGDLRPLPKRAAFTLDPGEARLALQERTRLAFPIEITFDRRADDRAEYVGRTHPLVEGLADHVLGRALAAEPDPLFARAGALFTRNVARRTAVVLLRIRYSLRERVEGFAEEVVVAAFTGGGQGITWLEPLADAGRGLLEAVAPAANISISERAEQVRWALDQLRRDPAWFQPIVEARVAQLQASHTRLRKLARAAKLEVRPHTPPDVLGCYVLVPTGGR